MTHVPARTLIEMNRHDEEYVHVPTLLKERLPSIAHQGGYATLGVHWGLIAEAPERREDRGRAGFWKLTETGKEFVAARLAVPKYARLYDGRCLGLKGELVTIRECLGGRFDYDELMRG